MSSDQTTDGVTIGVKRATALFRTFAAQMETLLRYRGGGKQIVTVQHVQVDAGGQAIVGTVNHSSSQTGGGGGMKRKSEEQPYEAKQNPFAQMPRCGAKTRSGAACQRIAGPKRRCRLHGGAPGSGAPVGNRNRLTHGRYTAAAIAERKAIRTLLKQSRAHLQEMRQE